MVCYTARSTDDNMWFLGECNRLWHHIESTNKNCGPQANKRSDGLKLLRNLHAKLSGRRHHKSIKRLWIVQQLLNDWNSKRCGLSWSRLCKSYNISIFEGVWQTFTLDLRRVLISHLSNGLTDFWADAQLLKCALGDEFGFIVLSCNFVLRELFRFLLCLLNHLLQFLIFLFFL